MQWSGRMHACMADVVSATREVMAGEGGEWGVWGCENKGKRAGVGVLTEIEQLLCQYVNPSHTPQPLLCTPSLL